MAIALLIIGFILFWVIVAIAGAGGTTYPDED